MKYIVTTTIHAPTEALRRFASVPGWQLLVVGDVKTPHDLYQNWHGIEYLSPVRQEQIDQRLSDLIGWNCIQRRNIGYLWALNRGAELIASVDDDNVPYVGWGETIAGRSARLPEYLCGHPCFDPLSVTNSPHLWHRGFPLQMVRDRAQNPPAEWKDITVDVDAQLWDGEPDVDSVCRMTQRYGDKLTSPDVAFTATKPGPFNSQNTIFTRRALRSFFCFPGVGRMDDIYASYVCQANGNRVAWSPPTVRQDRNEHNVLKDMQQEVDGYFRCGELVAALAEDREAWRQFVPERAIRAFDRYRELAA